MKILNVVGARPNFMKVAPLHRAFNKSNKIDSKILHTGQHYDERMSDIFFNQLGLPKPDFYLGVGGGSHTYQKANVMLKFEQVVQKEQPNVILVVGDVNATAACSIVGVKMGIPTVHVEAGLRSGDRKMPEEINRIITDAICNDLFVTEQSGMINLAKEGVPDEKIHFVGHVMIDSLIQFRQQANQLELSQIIQKAKNPSAPKALRSKSYVLSTMHRPQNVDNPKGLNSIIEIFEKISRQMPIVFAIHPRTEKNLKQFELYDTLLTIPNLILLEPQGYLQFLKLMDNAAVIITDSGGIQEETTYLKVPCLTFRNTTERPVTVDLGTNFLMKDLDPQSVISQFNAIINGEAKQGIIPPLWDGKASNRIATILLSKYGGA